MSTKTFIFQNEKGDFVVSCKVDCPSQGDNWIASQEEAVKERFYSKIEEALKELSTEISTEEVKSDVEFIGNEELLTEYVNCLKESESKNPGNGRVEAEGQPCRTIWLPVRTSNRTVTTDLNHTINGFDKQGLWGENGNCGTPYIIIDAPLSVTDTDRQKIGEEVNRRLGNIYPQWYNAMRASEAKTVREVVYDLFK